MDLRRKRHTSRLPPSPRHLVLRHARRRLQATEDDKIPAPDLPPGYEQLFSFYLPGLETGPYTISVDQSIQAGGQSKPVHSEHQFYVVGPRFTLPSDAVYSVYPPQGHSESIEVLPHVVLSDPTLPWERRGTDQPLTDGANNAVPWLAVLLFTQDELRLDPKYLAGESSPDSLFSQIESFKKDGAKQSSTLTVNMLVSDMKNSMPKVATPILYDADADGVDAKADFIFLTSSLFKKLFSPYDKDGQLSPPHGDDPKHYNASVKHHRYLAHLRHINTTGMALAGADADQGDSAFSIVVSHRIGPLDITHPTTVMAHLVSIEGVERMLLPVDDSFDKQFVAMTSLYSWQFMSLPPNSFNVHDAFQYIGTTNTVLRPSLEDPDVALLSTAGAIGTRLKGRLDDGYSLIKYRVETGDVTAAFLKGPCVPTAVEFPQKVPWPTLSTSGQALQVLDRELGIMDLSYSAAWQLGKTLALADQSFTAALSRVRKQIFDIAMQNAQSAALENQAVALGKPTAFKTKAEVIGSIRSTIDQLGSLSGQTLVEQQKSMLRRWLHIETPKVGLSLDSDDIDADIDKYLHDAAILVSSSTDGDGSQPYNEHNTPYSTDWMIVFKWVLDRMFLAGVPPHYLITDPSHLPLESLRIFKVDPYWVDALIDGGLSLANHVDQDDDRIRNAIKAAIRRYLTTPTPGLSYNPPLPTYGFFLHSALVTKFPDLIVETDPLVDLANPPIILRHEVISPEVMLCFMSEMPQWPLFNALKLRQPPHQQYFTAATRIKPDQVEFDYQKVFTVQPPPDKHPTDPVVSFIQKNDDSNKDRGELFMWGSKPGLTDLRILNIEQFASDYYQTLTDQLKPNFVEACPTSALMGIQLNEKSWQVTLAVPEFDKSNMAPRASPGAPTVLRHTLSARPPVIRPKPPPAKSRTPSDITCAPHPSFTSRVRSHVHRLAHNPPHFHLPPTKFIAPLPEPLPANPDDRLRGPSGPPNFDYQGFCPGSYPYTVMSQTYENDLVFSCVFQSGAQEFMLNSLVVRVPLAVNGNPGLIDSYSGAGVTMLSNLRLNVLASYSNDGNWLILTLMPRSTRYDPPAVLLSGLDEMSFILSGVMVHWFDGVDPNGPGVPIYCKVEENYAMQPTYRYDMPFTLLPEGSPLVQPRMVATGGR